MSQADGRLIKPETLTLLRNTILECFAQGQFHQVGIREICQKARVSPQTVYKYFGNKESLLTACIEQDMLELSQLMAAAAETSTDSLLRLNAVTEAFFSFYATRPRVAALIYLNVPLAHWAHQMSLGQQRALSVLHEVFSHAQQQEMIANWVNIKFLVEMCAGSVQRIVVGWLAEGCPDDLLARGRMVMQVIWQGVSVRE